MGILRKGLTLISVINLLFALLILFYFLFPIYFSLTTKIEYSFVYLYITIAKHKNQCKFKSTTYKKI